MSRLGFPSIRGHLPLVVALGVSALGSGVSGPLLLLFFVNVADLSLARAGTMLTAAGLVALVVPALVGMLVEKLGVRTIVIVAQLVQMVAFAGFVAARPWWLLLGFAVLAAVGQRAFWSSVFGLVAGIGAGRESDRWFALAGMVQAGGFAAGALLSGVLLTWAGDAPYLLALSADSASFLLSAVLLLRERAGAPPPRPERSTAAVLRDRPYLALIVVNAAFALCSVLLGIGLPIYITKALSSPAWIIGPLLAVVTVIGATCQGATVQLVRRWRRTRVLAASGALWLVWGGLTALVLVVPAGLVVPLLLVSVLLFAAAELLHAPTSNALAAAAAPPAAQARYLSYFQYSFTIAVILAPSTFAWLYGGGPALPWLAIGGLAGVAALAAVLLERWLPAGALGVSPRGRQHGDLDAIDFDRPAIDAVQ